jgi:hypothetical protein
MGTFQPSRWAKWILSNDLPSRHNGEASGRVEEAVTPLSYLYPTMGIRDAGVLPLAWHDTAALLFTSCLTTFLLRTRDNCVSVRCD